jgi:HEAT repeat protein
VTRGGTLGLALAVAVGVVVAPRCDQSGDVEAAAVAAPADSVAARVLQAARGADPLLCDLAALGLHSGWGWNGPEPLVGRSGDPEIAESIRWMMEPRGAGEVAALRAALTDPDPCARQTAARLLGRSREPRAIEALRQALAAADPVTRETGALGLGVAEDEDSIDELARALRDDVASVRIAAAWALGQIESDAAIEPLIRSLESDPEPGVRAAAAWALGEIE